jgi:uncharacterized membrane protein YkoI
MLQILTILLMLTLQASASTPGEVTDWQESQSSYHQAREAVRLGQAMPLQQARARLPEVMPGRVVATDYEFEFERWVYEFKVIDTHGRLRAVHLDAKTGELVRITDY